MPVIAPAQAFPGMEYIPLMLLSTAAGGLTAVVGVVAGLVTPASRTARTAGWTAVGFGAIPTLLYIPLTLGDVSPVVYAITGWPAVVGAAAIGLSKRPRTRHERTLVTATALVVAGLIGSGAAVAAVLHHRSASGEERVRALLDGQPISRLSSLKIEYQQREVHCTDPAVLRYLEKRLAQAVSTDSVGGSTHEVTLRFADGHVASMPSYWESDAVALSIGSRAASEGWPTHGVEFPPPMPDVFRDLLDFLAAPHQKVAGQVLTITPAGTTTDYDATLDLRAVQ